jgi:hypothetical protein
VSDEQAWHEQRPLLRIVRGTPDDDEVAALAAVVAGITARRPAEPSAHTPRSRWADRAALVRRPLPHGPGAWRASGLPY